MLKRLCGIGLLPFGHKKQSHFKAPQGDPASGDHAFFHQHIRFFWKIQVLYIHYVIESFVGSPSYFGAVLAYPRAPSRERRTDPRQ
jgi:hypothetical protein